MEGRTGRKRPLLIAQCVDVADVIAAKLARLRALEDLVHEGREPDIKVGVVHRVGDQAPGLDELAGRIDRGQPVAIHEVNDRLLMHLSEAVGPNDKPVEQQTLGVRSEGAVHNMEADTTLRWMLKGTRYRADNVEAEPLVEFDG